MISQNNPSSFKDIRSKLLRKRSTLERIQAFFSFLEQQGPSYISDLKQIGFDTDSVKAYVEIIRFIHSKPPIVVQKAGRYTMIQLKDV